MAAPLSCYHCGLPVSEGSHFQAIILNEPRTMCCPGCQAVAEAIVASGLESYYRHRSDNAANPEALPKVFTDELALYDRADVQRELVSNEGDLSEVCLLIEGISCAACGWLIEHHLKKMACINQANLNLSNHRLTIKWDASNTQLSQLLSELRRIGYAAHPYRADVASEKAHLENRKAMRQLGVAGLLWMQVMMAAMATWPEFNIDLTADLDKILRWTSFILTTPIIFYCCGQFFQGALRDLRTRHLTMDVSVSLAIGGAYLAGIWSTLTGQGELYFDAVGMFALFLLAGRYLERRARERTAQVTSQLINVLPASCLRINNKTHQQERVLLNELAIGDTILVPPGAIIPADATILSGHSSVDESLLTGEYLPQIKKPTQFVTGGTLNIEGPLTLEVNALGDSTRLSAIVRLLERAQSEKPKLAELADRFSQWFLIAILMSALILGIIWWQIDSERAFWIVLSLLVATCPCALSLATPTALTTATGTMHKLGLLITRGHFLESLNRVDTLIVDKTGTLTEGRLILREVRRLSTIDSNECLRLAAALESASEHPIARAFGRTSLIASNIRNIPGKGLEGIIDERIVRIGQPEFACPLNTPPIPQEAGQWLLLSEGNGNPLAWFCLDDSLRPDAQLFIQAAQRRGWDVMLLSGDNSPMVRDIAQTLGIQHVQGGLTPSDKLAVLKELHTQGKCVLMLGDGVNDVPILAGADISIAMGSGTDLAKTTADAVLLSNQLETLVTSINVAKRTRRIVIENLLWASLYNGLIIPCAALGWITPGWAAIGMSVSSLLVVLNALRLSRLPASEKNKTHNMVD